MGNKNFRYADDLFFIKLKVRGKVLKVKSEKQERRSGKGSRIKVLDLNQ